MVSWILQGRWMPVNSLGFQLDTLGAFPCLLSAPCEVLSSSRSLPAVQSLSLSWRNSWRVSLLGLQQVPEASGLPNGGEGALSEQGPGRAWLSGQSILTVRPKGEAASAFAAQEPKNKYCLVRNVSRPKAFSAAEAHTSTHSVTGFV